LRIPSIFQREPDFVEFALSVITVYSTGEKPPSITRMSNESRPQRDANAVVGLDQSNVKRVHILGCVVRERIDL
jgi:hypothetical protein